MNRKPVKFLVLFLSIFSLNDGPVNKTRLVISFALVLYPTFQFFMSAITNTDTIYDIVFPASHTLVLTGIITNLICLFCKRKNIRLLLDHMDRHMYIYSDESVIEPEYAWIEKDDNMVRTLMGICSYNIFIGLCMSVSPLVQLLVMGKVDILVYPGWIPWRIDKTTPFVITYIMHICMAAMCILAFDLLCVFPLLIAFEFRRQRKRLCAALATIEIRTQKRIPNVCNDGKCHAHRYNAVLEDNIIECIRHHQMLIELVHIRRTWHSNKLHRMNLSYANLASFPIYRTFKILQSWWAIVFSMQLAGSIVNFTLSVFTLMEVSQLADYL